MEGLVLRYDVASLAVVDGILGRFDEALPAGQVGETVFTLGAHIGEVIVRSAGARWVSLAEDHPLGGHWPMVQRPTSSLVNPVGMAFKRMENGRVDSIQWFSKVLVDGAAR